VSRAEHMAAFVADAGLDPALIRPLAADASFRQYFRIKGDVPHVLMDAPPEKENIIPFIAIAQHLRQIGLCAPKLIAQDLPQGFLLLEDLGDNTFTRLLHDGASEAELYAAAIDVLIDLHGKAAPANIQLEAGLAYTVPPYDDNALMTEVCLLTEWYLPACGVKLSAEALANYKNLWSGIFDQCRVGADVLVLRDYHVDNLMMLESGQVGLLDFQDALIGPPAYDLVSLLQDCRYHVPMAIEQAMIERYLAARPELDAEAFRAAYTLMGAQRHAKIIGIFTRLWKRDGKPAYLPMIPYLWDLLEHTLEHPALADISRWMDTHVPTDTRRSPLPGSPS
jgi:N-acetylmuramate 1-kinase